MLREVIIDGYNLLHAAHLARPSYGPGDLERCRKRLLMRVADLIDEPHRPAVTIVFDAKDPPADLPDRGEFRSMHVRYAHDHAEADDLIEELIHLHSTPKRLLVVSGDLRIRKAARGKGAHSITGEEFLDALEEEADDSPRKFAASHAAGSAPLADITQEFADIDVNELREEIESERKSVARSSTSAADGPVASSSSSEKTRPASASAPPKDEEPRIMAPENEVAFWNARIADLLREEGIGR